MGLYDKSDRSDSDRLGLRIIKRVRSYCTLKERVFAILIEPPIVDGRLDHRVIHQGIENRSKLHEDSHGELEINGNGDQ